VTPKEQKHLAIAVREVNDAPIAVAGSPEDLNLSVNQDITLAKNVSALFTDQDDAALQYSFVDAPSWLQLDASTGAITGLPGNADVGRSHHQSAGLRWTRWHRSSNIAHRSAQCE
jgi:hypothetical protein